MGERSSTLCCLCAASPCQPARNRGACERHVFDRYNITSFEDVKQVMEMQKQRKNGTLCTLIADSEATFDWRYHITPFLL